MFIAGIIGISSTVKDQLTQYWIFDTIVDQTMKVDELAMINGMFKKSSIHLREDGSQTSALMGTVDIGTWDVSDDGKRLILVSANGNSDEVEIIQLDDNYMSIRVDNKFTMKFKKASKEEKEVHHSEIEDKVTEKLEQKAEFEKMSDDFIKVSTNQVAKKWMMDGRDPKPGSSPESAELAKLLMAGSYLHLKPNGKFKLKVLGIKEKGSWNLENGDTQVVTKVNDGENIWNVVSVSNTELVLAKNNDPRRWYFKTK